MPAANVTVPFIVAAWLTTKLPAKVTAEFADTCSVFTVDVNVVKAPASIFH